MQSQSWNEENRIIRKQFHDGILHCFCCPSRFLGQTLLLAVWLTSDLYLGSPLGEAVVLREELLPLVFPQRGGGQVQVDVLSAPQKLLAPRKMSEADLTLFCILFGTQKRKTWQISFPSQFFKDKWNGLRGNWSKTQDKKFPRVTDYWRNNILAHYQWRNSRSTFNQTFLLHSL